MKQLNTLLISLVLIAGVTGHALAAEYDSVILNGRVIDPESKLDAVRNSERGQVLKLLKGVYPGKAERISSVD